VSQAVICQKAVKNNQRATDQQILQHHHRGQSRPGKFIQFDQFSDKPLYRDIFTRASRLGEKKTP